MQAIFESITNGNIELKTYLICIGTALLCGLITSAVSLYRSQTGKGFAISLLLLPPVVATVIMMVNGNLGTGVAVMGAFSLIRFRSVAAKAKDIVLIFITMTSGLACAAGYVGIAVLFTVFVSIITVIATLIPLKRENLYELRITIPEGLNLNGVFDEEFNEYTSNNKLIKVKTSNMGTLYKLLYTVELKDVSRQKELIDALRCKNGNLEISLCKASEGCDEL